MSDVKIEKQKSLTPRDAPAVSAFSEFFEPMRPISRFFGLSPFAFMREFADEMDRTFRAAPSLRTWAPRVDVQHCEGNLVVTAELAGLKKEEVKVEITDDALVIEGERRREHEDDHEGYHQYERSYGKFYRSIPLPPGAKTDQATAVLNEGVLKVSVPAAEEKKPRQVPIEPATEKAEKATEKSEKKAA